MQITSIKFQIPVFPNSFLQNLWNEHIPNTSLTLGQLLDPNNVFSFERTKDRKQTTLKIDLQDGTSWRVIRTQVLLPQVSPQQPPVVKWEIEKGKHHRSNNKTIRIQVPNINRALQRVFAENRQSLI